MRRSPPRRRRPLPGWIAGPPALPSPCVAVAAVTFWSPVATESSLSSSSVALAVGYDCAACSEGSAWSRVPVDWSPLAPAEREIVNRIAELIDHQANYMLEVWRVWTRLWSSFAIYDRCIIDVYAACRNHFFYRILLRTCLQTRARFLFALSSPCFVLSRAYHECCTRHSLFPWTREVKSGRAPISYRPVSMTFSKAIQWK